jgi:hypothetical protein
MTLRNYAVFYFLIFVFCVLIMSNKIICVDCACMHVVYLCVGDEYKGSRHSHKAYNRGDKSSWLFPDLDFCYGCRLLHYNSVKLPEQGKAAFHLSLSLSLSF